MPVSLADLKIVPFDPGKHEVSGFDCGDADLNEFLKNDAVLYQDDHLSHTRLVFLDDRLVGFITLLADCIILKTPEKKRILEKTLEFHQSIYTFPAVKIARIGTQNEYKGRGIGTQLLKYTVGVVARLNRDLNVGCRFITLDAYPASVSFYKDNGFVFNKHYAPRAPGKKERFYAFFRRLLGKAPPEAHPSMRYDILKSPQIA